jgi:hypothetical protein
MKALRFTVLFLGIVFQIAISHAQPAQKPILAPKADLKLQMPAGEGTNSGAVAWYPDHKKYYCAMAGNEAYPIEVFDEKGVHKQTFAAGFDIRGLWFNPIAGILEANVYEYHDIVDYTLDTTGKIIDFYADEYMIELPVYEPQSAMTLNTETGEYLWYDASSGSIVFIDGLAAMENRYLELKLPVGDSTLNKYCMGYTGITGYEYALLNYKDKKVYLINDTNGEVSATITLPAKAVVPELFGFSFANNRIWLFDVDKRLWTSYKIFN